MEAARKGSLTKKMTVSSQGSEAKSGKKSGKVKKRKNKKKTEKDIDVGKGSSTPQSPEGEDIPSAISDNPDVESDSMPTKEQITEKKSVIRNTSPKQQQLSAKTKPDSNSRTVAPYQTSSSNTKVKKSNLSSQSTRIKESLSQGSMSSKSSRSSCNISTGSSKTSINQSLSRTQFQNDIASKRAPMCESLRWENICDDPDDENERIKSYKLNRRKRYLAAANQKYSEWVKTLSGSTHSLTSNTSDYNSGSINNSSHESLLKSSSSNSTTYVKTINSAHTVQEGLVPGLATKLSMHTGGNQVMLNC